MLAKTTEGTMGTVKPTGAVVHRTRRPAPRRRGRAAEQPSAIAGPSVAADGPAPHWQDLYADLSRKDQLVLYGVRVLCVMDPDGETTLVSGVDGNVSMTAIADDLSSLVRDFRFEPRSPQSAATGLARCYAAVRHALHRAPAD